MAEFYDNSPMDVHIFIEAREQMEREKWERSRLVAYYAVIPHTDSKKGNRRMTDLIPFPWDKKAKSKGLKKLSKHQIKMLVKWEKRHGK